MYLKSIELHGFKSFAQKTVLEFLPPKEGKNSITVIVGPNGAGKSNISDAILWVLGEQSMKQLRGKKSSDIIFGGSEGKGQMSVAGVSLTLDNSDKRAPIDYEELVISRRLYRNGESEYIINGNNVRLLDLQILLAQAQFGHGSYSVIGQGMIDQLLLQSPAERKDFFDEATGIKEFQIKRHQAILKLKRSREHIEQASLILQEITPRLRSLSRQVKKLEQRQAVETQLLELQEQYYITLYNYYKTNFDELTSKVENINKDYEALQLEVQSLQKELTNLAKEESRGDSFASLQRNYQEIMQSKNALEHKRAVLRGRMQIQYSKAGKHQVGWLENKIDNFKEKLATIEKDIELKTKEQEKFILQLDRKQKEEAELQIRKTQLKGKIANAQQSLLEAKHQQTYRQFAGLRAVEGILSAGDRLGKVHGTVAQLGTAPEKYLTALDAAASANLSSIVVENDRVAQSCIDYLRRERLGFCTFLPVNKIRPRVVPKDIEEELGREGVHGFAIDLVKCKQKFADIFSYVLGSTLVVENIDVARGVGIGRVRMVTLDGDVLEQSGSMKGGYRKKKFGDMSFAISTVGSFEDDIERREKDIEYMEEDMKDIEKELTNLLPELQTLRSNQDSVSNSLELLNVKKQDADSEIASLAQELSLQTISKGDYTDVMKEMSSQREEIDDQIEAMQGQLRKAEKKLEAFHEEEEKKKQKIFDLQEKMQTKQDELRVLSQSRSEIQIKIAKFETRLEDLENELYQELRMSAGSLAERVESSLSVDDIDETGQEIQKLKYKLSLIGGIDEEVEQEYEETRLRHGELSTQIEDLEETIDDLESLIEELDKMMKKKREKAFRQIKKEFKRYFSILFEGGEADMIEVYEEESDNALYKGEEGDSRSMINDQMINDQEQEHSIRQNKRKRKILSGIEIKACPPGKKIKNIQALSGGEHTLTSLALICAILSTNPSPFVVLDEVEASLDEENTNRFTRILQELSQESQFILITHNRVTMHSADTLYGVTMGNDGISHLVSVNLKEIES